MSELEKFFAVEEEWSIAQRFLAWLQAQYDIGKDVGDTYEPAFYPVDKQPEEILAEFFGIDYTGLVQEREVVMQQAVEERRHQYRNRK